MSLTHKRIRRFQNRVITNHDSGLISNTSKFKPINHVSNLVVEGKSVFTVNFVNYDCYLDGNLIWNADQASNYRKLWELSH